MINIIDRRRNSPSIRRTLMPKFRTGVRQDAWIQHETVVEADTPEQAQKIAMDMWKGTIPSTLEEGDVVGFDHVDEYDLHEIERVDENGDPIL